MEKDGRLSAGYLFNYHMLMIGRKCIWLKGEIIMDKSNECMRAVRIVGVALMITPIIAALPSFLMTIFSGGIYPGPGRPVLSQEYGVASGLLITAGFSLI